MAFTQATIEALKSYSKEIKYLLEVRSSHPPSSTFTQINIDRAGFTLVRDRNELASSLVLVIPGEDLLFYEEVEEANPLALFSEVRLTAQVGTEREVLFQGFITDISEEEGKIRLFALDYCTKLERSICKVHIEGATTEEILNAPLFPLPEEFDEYTYGLRQDLTPQGFSIDGKRRSWKARAFRIIDGPNEIQPDFYRVYPASGVVRFLSPLPQSPIIASLFCYIEGTSDISEAVIQALTYPKEKGGAGISVGELALPQLNIDLNRFFLERGSALTSDCLALLKDLAPQNYHFYYDSDEAKFKHKLLVQSPQPERNVINLAQFRRIRTRESIYTRVIVHGTRTNPDNLALSAVVYDLQAGVGEVFRWNGSEKVFGEGTIELVRDGNDNSGFGRHNAPYDYTFYDFCLFDLGLDSENEPPIISSVILTASNSKNINSQNSANPKFSYAYQVLGSNDLVNYEPISELESILLKPLQRAEIIPFAGTRYRYIKLRVKPAKDGVSNENDPGLAVNEIRILGSDTFVVEASIQGSDPAKKFYYPELLEKTNRAGNQVLLIDVQDKLSEAEAKKLAEDLLERSLANYLAFEVTSISDPTPKIGQTVGVRHPVTGQLHNFLVERIEINKAYTKLFGRDYNAEVLS